MHLAVFQQSLNLPGKLSLTFLGCHLADLGTLSHWLWLWLWLWL